MSDMFGEDYYATNDCDEEKPVFDDDDDIGVIRKLKRKSSRLANLWCDYVLSY